MHDHVVSFDLNSLYPSLIMQYNMSPETIINTTTPGMDVEKVLEMDWFKRSPTECVAVGGQHFRTDVQGVLPRIIEEMYTERVDVKKAMIKAQKELQKVNKDDKQELYRIQKEISLNENRQMAMAGTQGSRCRENKQWTEALHGECSDAAGTLLARIWKVSVATATGSLPT